MTVVVVRRKGMAVYKLGARMQLVKVSYQHYAEFVAERIRKSPCRIRQRTMPFRRRFSVQRFRLPRLTTRRRTHSTTLSLTCRTHR